MLSIVVATVAVKQDLRCCNEFPIFLYFIAGTQTKEGFQCKERYKKGNSGLER